MNGERRRFSSRERTALYLAADGRCARCGRELEPGWHADHMRPYSRGGETDVINGQALCPDCNLKKADKVTELRKWQAEALSRFIGSSDDFLLVAAPGTGKTRLALTAAQRMMERQIRRVIVVGPTSHLRTQWSAEAVKAGIQLDHLFVNGAGAIARDMHGIAVTFSGVASEPYLFRKLCSEVPTLVVLDEIHHGGDELTWGDALRTAFTPAARRLLLSGTITRTDRKPVPFVTYDDKGNFIYSYKYDYGEALQDHVVRPIEFLALDGEVRWRDAGHTVATALVDADSDTLANALGAALDPDGNWITSVLRRADAELTRHRLAVPDAGGLVIAADQAKARRYAAILKSLTAEDPVLAISEEADSSDRIKSYAQGSARWIVAVQMISEGVDIPRLAVGVYASRTRTDLFFRQVTGRFVRMRSAEDETTATLLIPSIEPLLAYAREIEITVTKALDEEQERIQRESKDRDAPVLQLDLVEHLGSSEAVHHSTILSGEAFSDAELQNASSLLDLLPPSTTAAQLARVLRIAGTGRVVGTATVTATTAKPARSLAEEKTTLRRLVNRKVGYLNRLNDEPYSHIHHKLNRLTGDTAQTATAATLERRLEILDSWIAEFDEQ